MYFIVIGSSTLNTLIDFLNFEVYCLQVKGERSRDIGYDLMGIVEDSVEH